MFERRFDGGLIRSIREIKHAQPKVGIKVSLIANSINVSEFTNPRQFAEFISLFERRAFYGMLEIHFERVFPGREPLKKIMEHTKTTFLLLNFILLGRFANGNAHAHSGEVSHRGITRSQDGKEHLHRQTGLCRTWWEVSRIGITRTTGLALPDGDEVSHRGITCSRHPKSLMGWEVAESLDWYSYCLDETKQIEDLKRITNIAPGQLMQHNMLSKIVKGVLWAASNSVLSSRRDDTVRRISKKQWSGHAIHITCDLRATTSPLSRPCLMDNVVCAPQICWAAGTCNPASWPTRSRFKQLFWLRQLEHHSSLISTISKRIDNSVRKQQQREKI